MTIAPVYHTRKYITQKMREAGLIRGNGSWADRNYFRRLTLTHNNVKFRKDPVNGWQVATDDEIFQIIHELLPGGEGWWEPGKARFLPDGTLKDEALREQNEEFELVLPENPIEEKHG